MGESPSNAVLETQMNDIKEWLGKEFKRIRIHLTNINGDVKQNRDARKRFELVEDDIKDNTFFRSNIKFSSRLLWLVFGTAIVNLIITITDKFN